MNNHFLAEVLAITKKRGSGHTPVIEPLSVIENGTFEVPSGVDGYNPVTVNVPTGGGGVTTIPQSGVSFIDYDGSLVQHYSKEEFLALSAMPSNPSHDGLVAQGWNWSLANAQAYMQDRDSLIIGQMYTTDTGETRIYIYIDEDTPQNRLTFYLRFTSSVADNVDIDWGDGTVETKGSTTATNYAHTYAIGGEYVIKLKVNTGTISFVGNDTSVTTGNSIYGPRTYTYAYNRPRIRRVEVGNNVDSIGLSAFFYCICLVSITIPNTVRDIGEHAFHSCFNLRAVTIPNVVNDIKADSFYICYGFMTTIAIPESVQYIRAYAVSACSSLTTLAIPDSVQIIEDYTFSNCYSLNSIKLPNGLLSIGPNAFYSCYSLTSIIIPSRVSGIGTKAFSNCYGMSEYHFLPTNPPTLVSSDTFNNIPSDCKIYVPYSADHSILAAYQAANNWSTYASYMVEEPQP